MVGAAAYLVVTVVLGVALALNLSLGFLGRARFLALGVHIHVAALGWIFLVVIRVGRHLLPMFLLSHAGEVGERRLRASAALVAAGVAWLVLFHTLDIVTLGLVYAVEAYTDGMPRVTHTPTTPGCPMEHVIGACIETVGMAVPGVTAVERNLVFEPRWHLDMIRDWALGAL